MGYISAGANIADSKTTILPDRQYKAGYKIFHLKNNGPEDLSAAVMEWSVAGKVWGTLTTPSLVIANGGEVWWNIPQGLPYLKLSGATASGTADVVCRVWDYEPLNK